MPSFRYEACMATLSGIYLAGYARCVLTSSDANCQQLTRSAITLCHVRNRAAMESRSYGAAGLACGVLHVEAGRTFVLGSLPRAGPCEKLSLGGHHSLKTLP